MLQVEKKEEITDYLAIRILPPEHPSSSLTSPTPTLPGRFQRFTSGGTTFKGKLMGIVPTGKSGSITDINIFRIVDGKIVAVAPMLDDLGLMQQMGMIPTI